MQIIKLIKPQFWSKRSVISLLLMPFSCLYYLAHLIRFYIFSGYRSKKCVICVGNHVVGGGGKTPCAIALYKYLANTHTGKICFVTRGYGGACNRVEYVDCAKHTDKYVGDEAIILAQFAPTIVSKDRLVAIKIAEKDFDIIICDDGFQDPRIRYTYSFLVLSGDTGNNYIFPSGPLREPLKSAERRADLCVIDSNCNNQEYHYIHKNKLLLYKVEPIELPKSRRVILFCGIADPNKFFNFIKDNGYEAEKEIVFPDHYSYQDSEIEDMIFEASKINTPLVTTRKDYVKIRPEYRDRITCVDIDFIFLNSKILDKVINL